MVAALGRLVGGGGARHLRRHQRDAAGTERGETAGGGKCALDEAATLLVEGQRLSEAMAFVFRARFIVTCAHGNLPRVALVDVRRPEGGTRVGKPATPGSHGHDSERCTSLARTRPLAGATFWARRRQHRRADAEAIGSG